MDSILIVGSGGREHALAWKIKQSKDVSKVFVSPGNGGTASLLDVENIELDIKSHDKVIAWCLENKISLVIVGPEDPLANGIVNDLSSMGIPCFGPTKEAAQLESSKAYAKSFMSRHNLPTARWKSFTSCEDAEIFIKTADFDALVVKASGLAAGKGVIVADTIEEACLAVRDMLKYEKFGIAGNEIVIEELLIGEEVSCLAFSDGTDVKLFPPSQDHKRIYDGDLGPNTGGMGAYCPYPFLDSDGLEFIKEEVIKKTIDGMRQDGIPYVGILYAGLMLTEEGPKLLEFNCRFGDPETQVLLPLMKSDLYDVLKSCLNGSLSSTSVDFSENEKAVTVVAVSEGYPNTYQKNSEITFLDDALKISPLIFHAGTKLDSSGKLLTSGGRVLACTVVDNDLKSAASKALKTVETVSFKGKFYRKDIAHKALKAKCNTYKSSGVDISLAEEFISQIKPLAKRTTRMGCSAELGGFGGIFDLKQAGFSDPLLVSGTDGVGTKLKIAQACNIHQNVGIDLVAMCVNDILCHGAEPLFFLDYFASGKLDKHVAVQVVEGISNGCLMAGCALLGGETAEMPGMYNDGEYDIAGFAVGGVERKDYLPLSNEIVEGDVLIGLESSGLHSNGFSLVRKIVNDFDLKYHDTCPFDNDLTLGESLLKPTKIYCKSILHLIKSCKIKAFAHITGGGLVENLPRAFPDIFQAQLNANLWPILPVFGWLYQFGNIDSFEMSKTFNCGIGGVLIIDKNKVDEVQTILQACGEKSYMIGELCKKTGKDSVVIDNLSSCLDSAWKNHDKRNYLKKSHINKKRVAVLISGSGTNLQAIIDDTKPGNERHSDIVLVISNKDNVKGLERARDANIISVVINHKEYTDRESFDAAIHNKLIQFNIDIVCLAGFMRILTGDFVKKWTGKMLNIHPSLLPSFKGANAHKLVLEAGVRITGCTVHFVSEMVDAGAIIAQESIPVYPDDDEHSLSERLKEKEHIVFPKGLELVSSGKVSLVNNKVLWQI